MQLKEKCINSVKSIHGLITYFIVRDRLLLTVNSSTFSPGTIVVKLNCFYE